MAKKNSTGNNKAESSSPTEIAFDYIKSNFFRVVHADGVWGGPTPNQHIMMAFWSERAAIPQKMVFAVNPQGVLGDELKNKRESREALVREIEVSVVMDLPTAKAFLTWLKERIEGLEGKAAKGSSTEATEEAK